MDWKLEIHNLLPIGICFGWLYYPIDEEFDYGEFTLYLGLISFNYKYRRL